MNDTHPTRRSGRQHRTALAAPSATRPAPTMNAPARTVEVAGDNIELLCVPFGEFIVADRGPDGEVTVFREVWNAQSVTVPRKSIPLEVFHEGRHLAGAVNRWEQRDDGLYAFGRLSGSNDDKDRARNFIRDGVCQEVSVSFVGTDADRWSPPATGTRNALASVVRVGVPLHHVALVPAGALDGARVIRVITDAQAEAEMKARGAQALAEAEEAVRGPEGSPQRFAYDAQAEHRAALAAREAENRRRILAESDAITTTDELERRLTKPTPPPPPVVVSPWDGIPDDVVLARRRQALEVYQFTGGRDLTAWRRYTDAQDEATRRGLQ